MRIARFSALLGASLVMLFSAVWAGGFEISGVGARARGMGGAFRAVADDWTAAYYNPAGYARIYDNQLGANWAFFHLRHEIVPTYRWGGEYETGVFNDRINYNGHEVLSNPSAGFLVRLPVWGETILGLSAYQLFDNNITWTMFDPLPAYHDSVTSPADQFATNLDVVAFQFTAAREFKEDKLFFGLGLQVLRGDLVYSNIYFRENPIRTAEDPTWDILADRPYDRIPEWSKNNGNGWSFGLRGGLLWSLSEKLDFGATAALPFSISISGDVENRFYMPKNNSLWIFEDSAVFNDGSVGHLFSAGEIVTDSAEFETDLDLPASFGVGLAYRANDRLTLALDAQYTMWSTYEGLTFSYGTFQGLRGPADTAEAARTMFTSDLSAPVDWDNTVTVMSGASYLIADYLTLLGGVSYDQSPTDENAEFMPQFIDTGDKWGFSGGFIAHIQQWDLSLVTTYQKQPELTIDGFRGMDADAAARRFPGEYKAESYETTLSFNYRF